MDNRKLRPLQQWRPDLCSDCHRAPGDGKLRRGLCTGCYEYRRRRDDLPVKLDAAVLARKTIGEKVVTFFREPWDRFR